MADDLALAVGKIILAWGRLDQHLHLFIRSGEHALGDPPSNEGRFTERRKIFRRQCMRMTGEEDNYKRRFDKACAKLVRLERKRGRIAHGYADTTEYGAYFFDVPDSLNRSIDKAELALESHFTFPELAQLETDILELTNAIADLSLEAYGVWRLENPKAPAH